MITETKEIYKCEYCHKCYQVKRHCERHELLCNKNPENNRPCFSCMYLAKRNINFLLGYDYTGKEVYKDADLLYCKSKKIFLYTPQNEIKENFFDLGDELNEPMPKECDVYKNEIILDELDSFLKDVTN